MLQRRYSLRFEIVTAMREFYDFTLFMNAQMVVGRANKLTFIFCAHLPKIFFKKSTCIWISPIFE
ncbi:hypothetical protein SPHINGO8BC_90608 [Sphingobacterium multivorum]|uniref:Uncharacterized protein n=1 Tax=Sphingobacterium multivorum TaxID=28454 RepID=A0A654DRM7_SPHMU|nr:hypothetical protein SPHINGO8BC_90608 [Sphingobacterium multivorum]